VNDFLYANFNQYVGDYLSIYQNAANVLSLNGIPMWVPNIFLGGNFLGMQDSYSIFSPFFIISLLLPSSMLMELFLPLLFLKTLLAGGALYLYMKESKWFSPLTIGIALVLYLFHGWYYSYLNQFVFIELMIYIPFCLFGIEYLFSRGYKRYLVTGLSLLVTSHFSFTLLFLPFLFGYWWLRLICLSKREVFDTKKQIRLLIFSIITVLGVNLIFILPVFLASNTFHFVVEGSFTMTTTISTLFRTFIPSFHESYAGQLSFINSNSLALFQSAIVILLIPQFIKLISKQARVFVLTSYAFILAITLITQSLQIVNVSGNAILNLNVLSLLLLLFNALIVAYVLNDVHNLDINILNMTSWCYKFFLTLIIGLAFLYESDFLINVINRFSLEMMTEQFISFSPYFLIYVVMIILIDFYCYLLKIMADEYQGLRRKTMFVMMIIECIVVSYISFETHSHRSLGINTALADPDYLGNNVLSVSNHLRATDADFHRIINSFQVHGNEPLLRNYNGFSTANHYLLNEGFSWMLDEDHKDEIAISLQDVLLTTALGAKYYLTTDSVIPLPGYEYFDRVQGITIYKNKYFTSVGMNSAYYMTTSNFASLSADQKRYVFLQTVILEDEEAEALAEQFQLQLFDLDTIPETIGTIQYFEAAQFRQTLGIDQIAYNNNRYSHHYNTTEASLLVYSIPYERGWRAKVNGERTDLRQVNQGFIGVEILEAGDYEIILEYQTPGLLSGIRITILMLVLICGHFYKLREEEKRFLE